MSTSGIKPAQRTEAQARLDRILATPLKATEQGQVKTAQGGYCVTSISPGMSDRVMYARLFAVAPEFAKAAQMALPLLERDREQLVFSYASVPDEGEEYDPETIDDRHVYKRVKDLDFAIASTRAAIKAATGEA